MKYCRLLWLFACTAFALSLLPLRAEKVDAERAGRMAQRFVQSKRQLPAGDVVRLKYAATQRHRMKRSAQPDDAVRLDVQDTVFYYVFNIEENVGGGFVIVSGDDAVTPVLGYSDHGRYDENDLPPNFAYWMDFLQDEIRDAMAQNVPQNEIVRKEWEDSQNGMVRLAVSPLLQTTWDQTAPYSDLCPMHNSQRTPTGCTATALAQIMKYHRYPSRGTGQSEPYTTRTSGINVPAVDFNVSYNWTGMLNSYSSGSPTQQQRTAVATLMYHCAVGIKTNFTADGSGAYFSDVFAAMTDYFGYDKTIQNIDRYFYDDATWEKILREQIDAGLPVLYAGENNSSAHAFVCDGYDNSGRFHFNWGWGGSYDGYFVTSTLNPGTRTYNLYQEIIANIKPDAGGLPFYDLQLYNTFSSTASTVQTGNSFTVSASVMNVGNASSTSGTLGVALVNNVGQIVEIVGSTALLSIPPNYYYRGPLSISCIVPDNVTSGQYQLKAAFRTLLLGSTWELITESIKCPDHLNITVEQIILTPDPYEPNDTPEEAYDLPVNFTNNTATVKTTGSDFHTTTDIDYYKIILPAGYNYTINARLHDSYKSDDGNTYTVDAEFRYSTNGSSWSEWYDDVMNGAINISNEGTVYFHVKPYFDNRMGTYLLDMTIEREKITNNNANLSSLTVNHGALTPEFDAATTVYTVEVYYEITNITVQATTEDAGARITEGTGDHTLSVGSNVISVYVTAEDETTSKTYTITVTRQDVVFHTITFDTQNGSAVASQTVERGSMITQPDNPARDGFTFDGWFSDEACESAWDFETGIVTDDMTLYAGWTPITFTVTFDTQARISVPPQTVVQGGKATQPANLLRDGFTFAGWYKEADCINAWDFATDLVTADIMLYAKWTKNTVTGNETPDAPLFNVYPNPTNGALALQFETAGSYVMTISDMTGKILLRQTTNDQIVRLDISNYPAGVYLMTIDDGNRQSTIRVVRN